jgi:hypothetical protein
MLIFKACVSQCKCTHGLKVGNIPITYSVTVRRNVAWRNAVVIRTVQSRQSSLMCLWETCESVRCDWERVPRGSLDFPEEARELLPLIEVLQMKWLRLSPSIPEAPLC